MMMMWFARNDATPMYQANQQINHDQVPFYQANQRINYDQVSFYRARQRVNYDQVPSTLEQSAPKAFVLSAPSGADKRLGTLQMHLHSGNEQAWHEFSRKPGTMIFGKGVGKKAKQHADARHKNIIC